MIPVHVLLTSHFNCEKTMIYLILYLLVSTLHMKFFGCIWPMQESYEKHFKMMWYITITYNNAYFTYQLFWVYIAHEAMISETLTNYVISSNHLQKKYSYHLILNFGQVPKISHTAGSAYFIHTYAHYICWYEDTCNCKLSTWTAHIK